MTTTNDIDTIRKEWATQCGSCDYGLPYDCTCPKGDPRPKVAALCDEIEQLRAALRDTLDELKDRTAERDDARRLAALTAEQEAANAQIIVDTRAERDAARAMADELRDDLRAADESNANLQQHIADVRSGAF